MLVKLRGEVLATIGATRLHLAPCLAGRPPSDPLRQIVITLCASVVATASTDT